ncbi:TadE/TadG family type IV pilus assembly protein [Sphingomonas sp. ZT3P38]|jgi:Flp pilus assembly protein TadG|uniref:TadE/TadG family type IV pilus assembly protein n=1 Tax=Parasphingomonas zepuensis TaxID=3096161 RepID=UPI002FC9371F
MTRRLRRRISTDRRGATIVEFAIIAPVVGLLLLGAFDTAHSLYMRSVLQGIVQKVARDSALETGTAAAQQTVLDNKVRASVRAIANNATITITRRFYRTFSEAAAAQAEVWTDTDHNGTCNANEPYEDANNNNEWDRDGGNAGQGGAKDKTLYTVALSYPRFFPLNNIIGGSNTTRINASTVLSNQPYADQGSYGTPTVRNCS